MNKKDIKIMLEEFDSKIDNYLDTYFSINKEEIFKEGENLVKFLNMIDWSKYAEMGDEKLQMFWKQLKIKHPGIQNFIDTIRDSAIVHKLKEFDNKDLVH